MSKLIRHYSEGGIYFVTSVTSHRKPHLENNGDLLSNCFDEISNVCGFILIAHVVLPDHFHALIDPKENCLSTTLKRIKLKFSYRYRLAHGLYRETIWQPRFWDHRIRDEADLNRHIDYTHYNPVKHGLVRTPYEWKYTSLHEYWRMGYYQDDWGSVAPEAIAGSYGE